MTKQQETHTDTNTAATPRQTQPYS
jgi:hypothetical protein